MFIKTDVGEYPLNDLQIRSRFPNTSFPSEFVPPDGYAWVHDSAQPAFNPVMQKVEESSPALTDGKWYQTWAVTPKYATSEALAAAFQDAVVVAIQTRLDDFARTRNYDGILSACTYATSAVPKFKTEGQCCVDARDATWSALYALLAEVQAGATPMPETVDAVLTLLPKLNWSVA